MQTRRSPWHMPAKLLFAAVLALAVLLAAAGWLALQDAPSVPRPEAPTVSDVTRVRTLLQQHDPRRSLPGMPRHAALSEADVNLLLARAAAPAFGGQAAATLDRGAVTLRASRALAWPVSRRWLNVEARFRATGGWPELTRLQVGRLELPPWLARVALGAALRHWQGGAPGRAAVEMLRSVTADTTSLQVLYVWLPASAERLLGGLTPPADAERLQAYTARLAELAARAGEPWAEVPLNELLTPMFALARDRSADADADVAAREHRALLLALAVHAVGRNLGSVVPQARAWARPMPLRITLAGRDDFAQHFLVSAFLAAEAGGPLSDAVGTYKELADARIGSGFSFNDIAVDRAGSRFGQLAVREPVLLQQRVAGRLRDADLLPDVSDLPEFLSENAFLQRFGSVEAPAYRAMLADIERRLAGVRVLR